MPRVSRLPIRLVALAAALSLLAPLAGTAPVNAAGPAIGGIEIEVPTPTGNAISGTVKNGTATPIPGMLVVACTTALEECRGETTSAANGTFSIGALTPDTYAIGFFPPDGSDYLAGWYTPTGPVEDFAGATSIDVTGGNVAGIDVVAVTGHTISGKLTGAGPGGVGLPGIEVSASGEAHFGFATTDALGNYTVRGLGDDTYQLAIRVPSAQNFRGGGVVDGGVIEESDSGSPVVVSGSDVTGMDVLVPRGLRMSGTLTGPEAAGASVSAYGSSNSGEAITIAPNGQWAIVGLWPGSYTLVFAPAETDSDTSTFPLGYWSGGPTLTADPDASVNVVLVSSNVTGLNAAIPHGLSISGTVVGDDGSPLEDAYLFVCGLTSGCASTRSNLSGVWAFHHVLPDSYLVDVSHPQNVGGFFGSGGYALDAPRGKRVPVSTADVAGVDVVLPSGASMTGHISSADGPVEGAYVSAIGTHGISPASPGSDRSAADGSFVLRGLTEDDYTISVSFDPDSPYLRGYFDAESPQGFTEEYDLATVITIGDAATGSSYVPINPKRVVDSRSAVGVSGIFSANVPRTFQVAGVSPIPANAIAVTGNVTVVNQTSAGYVSLTPTATANPKSSTINFPLGDVRANNFTMPLDGAGRLSAVFKASAGKATHLIVDVTGYFLADDAHATYAPITPTRALDTRTGKGLTGRFVANQPRTLSVAGIPGIPIDATAVTANVTVVGQTRAGYLSVTPNSTANPTTSTLNFPLGDTRANGLTARLNAVGDLSIVYKAASGSTTDVLLDITGYYSPHPGGLLYYPLSPGRIVDTRPGVLASELVGTFNASSPRTFEAIGHARIPLEASAIIGNLTIVGPTSGGYVSLTPLPVANPTTSTINFPAGDTRANGATVPLSGAGKLSGVFKAPAGSKTHLIIDITGYFR